MSKLESRNAVMTLEGLAQKKNSELIELYKTLEAPDIKELEGEYAARMPIDREENFQTWIEQNGGHWLGKAFSLKPVKGMMGQGHNLHKVGDKTVRHTRFGYEIGVSPVDGKNTLLLKYSVFNNGASSIDLLDEIRPVKRGLYLGVYTTIIAVPPFTLTQEGPRSSVEAFLLGGPVGPWQGVDDPSAE